jgi:hypothetical protein
MFYRSYFSLILKSYVLQELFPFDSKIMFYRSYFPMILKSYILQELFPFQIDNRVHVKFNENNTYLFPHNLFKILISFKQLVKFIFGIKSSSVYKVQISTNYEKIMLKFIVLYIAFCYTWYFVIPGIILLVLREITHIKTGK